MTADLLTLVYLAVAVIVARHMARRLYDAMESDPGKATAADWWMAVALGILIGLAWPFTVIARVIVGRRPRSTT